MWATPIYHTHSAHYTRETPVKMSDWDDSDSCRGYNSEYSDDGDLPSFPTFSSPAKPKERPSSSVASPSGIIASLSAATLSGGTPEKSAPPTVDTGHFSPHNSYTDKKALERSRKLARKAEELAQKIKVKTERNEKVQNIFLLRSAKDACAAFPL